MRIEKPSSYKTFYLAQCWNLLPPVFKGKKLVFTSRFDTIELNSGHNQTVNKDLGDSFPKGKSRIFKPK